jgi:transcriptional regulator with XRE-family HTH domain
VSDTGGIGDRLREARKRRGLTQRELAQLTGLSVSLVRKVEQGDYGEIRLETVWSTPGSLEAVTSGKVGAHGRQEAASR